MTDKIDLQNAEFKACRALAEALRIHDTVAVVDDDYPEVRHKYESALKTFIDALAANGRPLDPGATREHYRIAAKALKIIKLRAMPGMDEIAVRLNCEPMDGEILQGATWGAALQIAKGEADAFKVAAALLAHVGSNRR